MKTRVLSEERKRKLSGNNSGESNSFYGRKHTVEARVIMSEKAKNRVIPIDVRVKMSEAQKGERNHFYGKKHTEETKRKISETKQGCSPTRLGAITTEETKQKISMARKGKYLGRVHNMPLASRLKLSRERKGIVIPEHVKRKMSQTRKKMWQDPEYRDRTIKNSRKAMSIHPNKPETIVLGLLNELFPNDWEFVGDGKVVIEGKIPDFINTNGQKKIIEMYGDYWHGEKARCYEETEEGRIALFKKYGYSTLIVWENELKDIDKVKDKIKEFAGAS